MFTWHRPENGGIQKSQINFFWLYCFFLCSKFDFGYSQIVIWVHTFRFGTWEQFVCQVHISTRVHNFRDKRPSLLAQLPLAPISWPPFCLDLHSTFAPKAPWQKGPSHTTTSPIFYRQGLPSLSYRLPCSVVDASDSCHDFHYAGWSSWSPRFLPPWAHYKLRKSHKVLLVDWILRRHTDTGTTWMGVGYSSPTI